MHVIIDLCVVPIGVGVSVAEYVVACQRVLREAGLEHRLRAQTMDDKVRAVERV